MTRTDKRFAPMVVLWAVPVTLYFLRKYLSSFSSSEIELSALNYRAPGGSMVTLDKVIPFENILGRKLCESAMQAFRRKIATPNRRDRASLSLAYHAYWSIYHGEERYALISPGKCTCNFKDEFTLCASGARFELSQLIKSKPSLLTSTDSTGATLLYIACRGGVDTGKTCPCLLPTYSPATNLAAMRIGRWQSSFRLASRTRRTRPMRSGWSRTVRSGAAWSTYGSGGDPTPRSRRQ